MKNEDEIFDLADTCFGPRRYNRGQVVGFYQSAHGDGVSDGARMMRESYKNSTAERALAVSDMVRAMFTGGVDQITITRTQYETAMRTRAEPK